MFARSIPGREAVDLADRLRPGPGGVRAEIAAAHRARRGLRRLLGALAYRPLHPIQHGYLAQPLTLIACVNVAILVDADGSGRPASGPPCGPSSLALILVTGRAGRPAHVRRRGGGAFAWSRRSEGRGADGRAAGRAALVCVGTGGFLFAVQDGTITSRLLDHSEGDDRPLDARGGPDATCAVPLGERPDRARSRRSTPRRASSGCGATTPTSRASSPRALETTPDSVIVWSPSEPGPEPRLALPLLTHTIERLYTPSSRFGLFEVWTRNPNPGTSPGRSQAPSSLGSLGGLERGEDRAVGDITARHGTPTRGVGAP